MKEITAEVLFRAAEPQLRFLPEGPQRVGSEHLSWISIQHGKDERTGSLNVLNLTTCENVNYPLPGRPGFAFPTDQPDTWVIGLDRRVVLFHSHRGEIRQLCDGIEQYVSGTIINDGCSFQRNLIFGTKDEKFKEKKAGLYLWRASDERLIQLRDDQICSNGKFVQATAAALTLFDIDSPTRQIVAYPLDLDAGQLGPSRVVVDMTDDEAVPDGMVVTPDGQSVVVAMFHPGNAEHGQVRQYRLADGQLEAVWHCEHSPRVTCPQLVQVGDRVRVVATTAVEGMPAEQLARCLNAGALFIADTTFPRLAGPPTFPS